MYRLHAHCDRRKSAAWLLAGSVAVSTSAFAQCDWLTPLPGGYVGDDVHSLCVFDEDGGGPALPALFAGGVFVTAGIPPSSPASRIARWSGQAWSPLGAGISTSEFYGVYAMTTYDHDGPGPLPERLIVGGEFFAAGGVPAQNVAAWDGTSWSAMGTGLGHINALCTVDMDGTGPAQPTLFTSAGGLNMKAPTRWTGTNWASVIPFWGGLDGGIRGMTGFDDDGAGPGSPALFVCGDFFVAHLTPAARVAKWDGAAWSPLGSGLNGWADSITVFDRDEAGPDPAVLIVGGNFSVAGGAPASCIAAWNGSSWSTLGSGFANSFGSAACWTLATFDPDGGGPRATELFAGGTFTTAGSIPANYVARWDGAAWHPLGVGVDAWVNALLPFDVDGAGPQPAGLMAGGYFQQAGGQSSSHIARWACDSCYPDCNGNGALTIADFGCFQSKFVALDPYADCNQSSTLTIADFGCFQAAFAQGCQ